MLDVARFLGLHAPFSGLEATRLERVAAAVEVDFYTPGTVVIAQGGEPSEHVYVVRRGAMELVDRDRVVDVLGEGDLFGFPSMLSGEPPIHEVRAREETLCYLVPDFEARSVFSGPSGMQFLTMALRQRVSVTSTDASEEWETLGDIPLGALVTIDANTTIVATAKKLTEARATAAVVVNGDDVGIVTDRDIRAKVVGAGVSPDGPVADIATRKARTARTDERTETAIVRMLELGIHHLPLVDEAGVVVGMVTDLDLMAQRRRQSFRLRSEIERATDVEAVAAAANRVQETLIPMIRAGVDVDHLDVVTATLFDAITTRLVELAQSTLGAPPVPFAWIALGPSGRREQGFRSSQDHAIVYGGASTEPDAWFRGLAESVSDGLARSGFELSPSQILATEPEWRGPEAGWRDRVTRLMSIDDPATASAASAAFDGRVITGALELGPLFRDAVAHAARTDSFLDRLRLAIVDMQLPVGFFDGRVVSEDSEAVAFDVDMAAIKPITDMARLFSLSAGIQSVGSVRRLREATAEGVLDAEIAEGLGEALELLRELRTEHQAEQWTQGRRPDTTVQAAQLGPLERRALRDAFRLVRDVQRSLDSGSLARSLHR